MVTNLMRERDRAIEQLCSTHDPDGGPTAVHLGAFATGCRQNFSNFVVGQIDELGGLSDLQKWFADFENVADAVVALAEAAVDGWVASASYPAAQPMAEWAPGHVASLVDAVMGRWGAGGAGEDVARELLTADGCEMLPERDGDETDGIDLRFETPDGETRTAQVKCSLSTQWNFGDHEADEEFRVQITAFGELVKATRREA
jgi:hypothetical protein